MIDINTIKFPPFATKGWKDADHTLHGLYQMHLRILTETVRTVSGDPAALVRVMDERLSSLAHIQAYLQRCDDFSAIDLVAFSQEVVSRCVQQSAPAVTLMCSAGYGRIRGDARTAGIVATLLDITMRGVLRRTRGTFDGGSVLMDFHDTGDAITLFYRISTSDEPSTTIEDLIEKRSITEYRRVSGIRLARSIEDDGTTSLRIVVPVTAQESHYRRMSI